MACSQLIKMVSSRPEFGGLPGVAGCWASWAKMTELLSPITTKVHNHLRMIGLRVLFQGLGPFPRHEGRVARPESSACQGLHALPKAYGRAQGVPPDPHSTKSYNTLPRVRKDGPM